MDADETRQLVEILEDLRLKFVVHELAKMRTGAILETAIECDLTFYDLAHLQCAETLVTKDQELSDASGEAKRRGNCTKSSELMKSTHNAQIRLVLLRYLIITR